MPLQRAAVMDPRRFSALMERRKLLIEQRLCKIEEPNGPKSIYGPAAYVLSSGGKRVRAILTMLSCEACGGTARGALPAASAIEVLHNFTLVHDDIMDKADLRRGRPTVHVRWNSDTAILSGDLLAALAYEELLRANDKALPAMMRVFTRAFTIVCEGQGFDKEFEERDDVRVDDYLMMIDKKTAQVISAAAELGALSAGAPPAHVRTLRSFGKHLGRAFQLRDDVLDIDGTEAKIGKRIGTDIIEGKRTCLLLMAAERATGKDKALVRAVLRREPIGDDAIPAMRDVYYRTGALDDANALIARETRTAQRALATLKPGLAVDALQHLAGQLVSRAS